MNCPKCGQAVERGARYCTRCQNLLAESKPIVEKTGRELSRGSCTAEPGEDRGVVVKRHRVIILGYQEWYAIKWNIGVQVDGRSIGSLSRNGRLDVDIDEICFEVQLCVPMMWFKAKPVIFRCSGDVTILQIVTSRWLGTMWVEQRGEVCQ